MAHFEENEHKREVCSLLQIWVLPWKKDLKPVYHHSTSSEREKRKGFVPIIGPLNEGTVPIFTNMLFDASIIPQARSSSGMLVAKTM